MEFRILGPLEVVAEHGPVRLGGSRQRVVLALLLVHAGQVIPLDRLIDAIWDDRPPPTASQQVRICVSALRRILATAGASPDVIGTTPSGYQLRADAGPIDARTFEEAVRQARAQIGVGDQAAAAARLRAALALWRGPALAGLPHRAVQAHAARLEERRLAVLQECIELELGLGRHRELVAELRGLVAEQPLNERFQEQLVSALHRSGRRADALAAYRQAYRSLADELGVNPGPELQQLERTILTGPPPVAPPPRAKGAGQLTLGGLVPRQLPTTVTGFTGPQPRIDLARRPAGR
jgi:DNA-binding SARP family transcriptional activator